MLNEVGVEIRKAGGRNGTGGEIKEEKKKKEWIPSLFAAIQQL